MSTQIIICYLNQIVKLSLHMITNGTAKINRCWVKWMNFNHNYFLYAKKSLLDNIISTSVTVGHYQRNESIKTTTLFVLILILMDFLKLNNKNCGRTQ